MTAEVPAVAAKPFATCIATPVPSGLVVARLLLLLHSKIAVDAAVAAAVAAAVVAAVADAVADAVAVAA
eukprot:13640832-Alexandrium_andersonii.AAC.1